MPAPSPDQTARSSDTMARGSQRAAPGIRWVFPCLDLPVTRIGDRALLLGRDEDCDVILLGAETSRRHAELRRSGPLGIIRDLGSMNGVFLNGTRVQKAALAEGDVIRLGESIGVVVALPDDEDCEHPAANGPAAASAFCTEQGMLVGPVLAPVLELARRAVRAGLSTVLEGETGTGKELLARAMHAWSQRLGPFVAVNCAALPETLAEAELFGYRKGAFTGASRASAGQLRGAHRGTLLLDEIQRLAPALQAKLLRVLDQREVVPLGEAVPVPIDVFVLAATQRPLGELVEKAQFARDLQMRLEGATLKLPTLRARRQELGFLLAELLAKYGGERVPAVDARLVEALCLYDWPGNLRELDQLVHRLLSLRGHEPRLRVSHLPAHVRQRAAGEQTEPEPIGAGSGLAPREAPVAAPERLRVRPLTREVLAQALRARGGNVQRAAEDVGVRRQDFYRFFSKRELAAFRRARRSDPGGEPE